ncbi:hypothetical protein ABIC03_003049 [Bradyrhizobium sp. RT6a]
MDALTLFGLFAVTAMLVTYALEDRSHWFVLLFAMSCVLGSAYGFLQGAWPFGVVGGDLGRRGAAALASQAVDRPAAPRRAKS